MSKAATFPVRFYYADVKSISLKRKNIVKRFVLAIFAEERKFLEKLDYIFCSDSFLLDINKKFLHHNFYTDIITFDLSNGEAVSGEIYISIDRINENAASYSASFKSELLRVIFHGALHLCGYRDKKKSEKLIMRRKEDYYLQLFEKNLK